MVSSTSLPPIINGGLQFNRRPNPPHLSAQIIRTGWARDADAGATIGSSRTKGHALRVLANPNVSSKKGSSNEVIMVDPLEAKRLAAKQMQEIQAKEKLKRKRQIEAINGAWAMLGLAAGIVIEGQTGKGILQQLADYWDAVIHFFMR